MTQAAAPVPGPHRYPDGLRVVFGVTTAIMAAVTLLFVWMVMDLPWWQLRVMSLACGAVTGWGVMHCVGWMARVRETLAATPRGLLVTHGGTQRLIEWNRITALRSRDTAAELRALGAGGQILACIGYHVTGFDALRDEIVASVRLPAGTRFRSSRLSVSIAFGFAAVAALFLVGAVLSGGRGVIAGPIMAALLYVAASLWWTIRIGPDGFEIRRPFQRVRVPFSIVQGISLGAVNGQHEVRRSVVTIERRGEKPIVLRNPGHDAIALYLSLRAAHRAYHLAAPAPTPPSIARP